jgi:branched-chain amino acid transport system substrate-binding protein
MVRSRAVRLALPVIFVVVLACVLAASATVRPAEPIKIGLGMALSGQLAANGKAALVGMKIWEEDVNRQGGLLGRPVRLVYYDDQSSPANVPGIYAKLLDIDKVDLIVSGYATNMIVPALIVAMQHKKLLLGLFGTAVNGEFHYPRYFSMNANGPDAKRAVTAGLFEVAAEQNPKPQSVAIIAADAEFGRNAAEGARENAKAAGMTIVYDRTYPPAMTDLSPIVRAIAAAKPDVLVICTYPVGTVAMLRAVNEVGFTPKLMGGAMVGLQSTAIKMQLGPLLNGVVNYDSWLPTRTMQFPGSTEFLAKYQARAAAEGVDPLGFNLPPFGYADLQVLQQAIAGTHGLDDGMLAEYLHANAVKTIIGALQFGPDGEWTQSRMLQVQYRGIRSSDVAEFKDMDKQVIVTPARYKTGDAIYPYADAKK